MALECFEIRVLDHDELSLRDLPALDDLVGGDFAVMLGTPALLLDRGLAFAVQKPERNVRLAGCRLRRGREPDGDADETEAQGTVPGGAHDSSLIGDLTHSCPDSAFLHLYISRAVTANRTIARLWRDAVAKQRSGTAYLTLDADDWRPVTWAEAATRVENMANGLLARGVRKGEAFGTLARTTLEWSLFDFALAQVGAVGAPVYANSSPRDVLYILDHSESIGVLCEDAAQRAKVEEVRDALPQLRHVLTFDDLAALEAEGAAFKREHPQALDDAVAAIGEEDLFTFIYTSGTTGQPKGCMIRHRNYYAMAAVIDHLPLYVRNERPDAALPAARPQLRPADAPDRPVRRLHDRVPARSAADRGGAAAGAPDGVPERPARLREDPHRRRRRRSTRRRASSAGSPTGRSPSAGA